MSDCEIHKILGSTNASWVDFSDKSSWFQDEGLTLMAIRMEDVRYIKDKANGSAFRVRELKVDSQDRYYVEHVGNKLNGPKLFNMVKVGRKLSREETAQLEKRFMRDLGINTCPPCNGDGSDGTHD